jgi:hypothetical protein
MKYQSLVPADDQPLCNHRTHAAGAAMLVWAIMGSTSSSLFLLPAELLPASLYGEAMIVFASLPGIMGRFL